MKKLLARSKYYELAFSILLLLNILLLLYFISKLNQIETLARETQAQAQELLRTIRRP